MKVFLLATTIFVAVSGLTQHEQWASFKLNHSKFYNNIVEEKLRFQIFNENLKKIADHNGRYEKGEVSYALGINKFADLTESEFIENLRRQLFNKPQVTENFETFPEDLEVPASIDWREKGAVLPVQNQGSCGSCWSFSTLGSVEGQNAILNNVKIPLSEQELIDCGSNYNLGGCNGGWPTDAIDYIKDNGIQSEASYPYTGRDGNCKRSGTENVIKTKGYKRVDQTEEALKAAVGTVGPISICMNANSLQLYSRGIFDSDYCPSSHSDLDHAVLVVGYGTESGSDYWIVKNSWGTSWGENGFFRIRQKSNICGILLEAVYPIL